MTTETPTTETAGARLDDEQTSQVVGWGGASASMEASKPQPTVNPFAMDLGSAPATIQKLSGRINDAFAEKLWTIASANANGVSNHKVYPSRDDPAYKADSKLMQKHLASRLDPDKARAAVVPYKSGSGIGFAVQIKTKTTRKPRTPK